MTISSPSNDPRQFVSLVIFLGEGGHSVKEGVNLDSREENFQLQIPYTIQRNTHTHTYNIRELTSARERVLVLAGGMSVLSSKNFLAVSATSPYGRVRSL